MENNLMENFRKDNSIAQEIAKNTIPMCEAEEVEVEDDSNTSQKKDLKKIMKSLDVLGGKVSGYSETLVFSMKNVVDAIFRGKSSNAKVILKDMIGQISDVKVEGTMVSGFGMQNSEIDETKMSDILKAGDAKDLKKVKKIVAKMKKEKKTDKEIEEYLLTMVSQNFVNKAMGESAISDNEILFEGIKIKEKDMKNGLLIVNIKNPKWGTFVVQDKYDKGIWNIRGDSGARTINSGELKFWEKVSTDEAVIIDNPSDVEVVAEGINSKLDEMMEAVDAIEFTEAKDITVLAGDLAGKIIVHTNKMKMAKDKKDDKAVANHKKEAEKLLSKLEKMKTDMVAPNFGKYKVVKTSLPIDKKSVIKTLKQKLGESRASENKFLK